MAVIINDFEVIVDPPAQPGGAAPKPTPEPSATPPLSPQDIREMERHLAERCRRIRAH